MNNPVVLLIGNENGTLETIKQHLTKTDAIPVEVIIYRSVPEVISDASLVADVIIVPVLLFKALTQNLKETYHKLLYQPVIVVAEKDEEAMALLSVTNGASDYLIQDETDEPHLQKAIRCAIARSGINFKQFFEESPAPMYIYDKETYRFLAVNTACQKQYGYDEEELLSMKADQIRPQEEAALFREASRTAPEEYHDYGRWKHRKKNSDVFIVNIYARDTQFNGRMARLVTAVDVSRTVTAEQQVEDKNKEVNNILESITDGFCALNTNGDFTYVNKECEKIFGLRREKMIGKNIWDIYDREELADFYTQYRQAVENRINTRFEGYVNGIDKWLSVTAYPTRNGLVVYLVDITERIQIRQKLYNDEQQLRAIINNTTDMIWLLDRDGNIIISNNAFRKWMQQMSADTDATTLPAAVTTNWKEHFDIAFDGQPLTFTAMETHGDALFYREVNLYPVRDESGHVISISCFASDVTQQQLRLQKIQLQNQYLEKIAWMHSHEARGPVANIMGLASLFEMNDPSDPDNKMMMELIIESSQQLDKVIRKIVADIDTYQLNYGDEE